jgi:hypothetical protein
MSGESFTVEGKKLDEKGRLVPVDLTIDASKVVEHVKKVEEENEDLREERDSLKSTLELVAQKAFDSKKAKLQCFDDSIDTPAKLQAWQLGKQSTSGIPSGSAPLNDNQTTSMSGRAESGFDSMDEMFSFLEASQKLGDKGAKKILDQFVAKNLKILRDSKASVEFKQDEPLKDTLNRQWRLEQKLKRQEREEKNVSE